MLNYPKVKILRAEKREGLIRARLLGARAATGNYMNIIVLFGFNFLFFM